MKELTAKQQWAMEKMSALSEELMNKETGKGGDVAACRQVGISDSVYNAIKKGTYTGNVGNQLKKVIEYFENKEQAAAAEIVTDRSYKPTSISTMVYKAIKSCQLRGGIVVIQGDPGVGKTQACKEFYKDNRGSSVFITVNSFVKSQRTILELIGKQLGVSYGASSRMWQEIVNKMSDGMVIIIDEAQHLTGSTIDGIRSFCDVFADQGQTLGLALVGNDTIYSKIKKAGLNQIDNRIKDVFNFSTAKVKADDLKLLFPEIADDDEAINFLLEITHHNDKSIRGAENLYYNAKSQHDVSCSGLAQAAKIRNGLFIN